MVKYIFDIFDCFLCFEVFHQIFNKKIEQKVFCIKWDEFECNLEFDAYFKFVEKIYKKDAKQVAPKPYFLDLMGLSREN